MKPKKAAGAEALAPHLGDRRSEAQRFLAGLHRAREGGAALRCADLVDRLNDHAKAMGALEAWTQAAAGMWDGPGRGVSGDEVAAGLVADGLEGRDAKMAALLVATAYVIEALRFAEANDETQAWSRAFDALNWESVLSSNAPDQRMDSILQGASKGGKKGAETRKKDAINPAEVIAAAEARGWPEKEWGISEPLAIKFGRSARRIRQILDEEVEKRKSEA